MAARRRLVLYLGVAVLCVAGGVVGLRVYDRPPRGVAIDVPATGVRDDRFLVAAVEEGRGPDWSPTRSASWLLDVTTGRYERWTGEVWDLSPDLRYALILQHDRFRGSRLAVVQIATRRTIWRLPSPHLASWSPNARFVVMTLCDEPCIEPKGPHDDGGPDRVLILDLAAGTSREIRIRLPAAPAGWTADGRGLVFDGRMVTVDGAVVPVAPNQTLSPVKRFATVPVRVDHLQREMLDDLHLGGSRTFRWPPAWPPHAAGDEALAWVGDRCVLTLHRGSELLLRDTRSAQVSTVTVLPSADRPGGALLVARAPDPLDSRAEGLTFGAADRS